MICQALARTIQATGTSRPKGREVFPSWSRGVKNGGRLLHPKTAKASPPRSFACGALLGRAEGSAGAPRRLPHTLQFENRCHKKVNIKNTRNEQIVIFLYLTRKSNWCIVQHVAKAAKVMSTLIFTAQLLCLGLSFRQSGIWQRSGGKQNEEAV